MLPVIRKSGEKGLMKHDSVAEPLDAASGYEPRRELSPKEKAWLQRLRKALQRKPRGIEIIVSNGTLEAYPTGTLNRHLGDRTTNGFGITQMPLETIHPSPLIPYGEGS